MVIEFLFLKIYFCKEAYIQKDWVHHIVEEVDPVEVAESILKKTPNLGKYSISDNDPILKQCENVVAEALIILNTE